MLPATYDLILYRGDSRRIELKLFDDSSGATATDLTGVTAAAQIRNRHDGDEVVDLTCAITLPNEVNVTIDAVMSRTAPRRGVWDLQLTWPSGDVQTPIAGSVKVKADVTHVVAVTP